MTEVQEIIACIKAAHSIVITSHKSPDGDSVGSSLGMYRFLKEMGKEVVICHPDPCPAFLEWLKEGDTIVDFETSPDEVTNHLKSADLIFCLDYNGSGRLGKEMGEVLDKATADKIMIDHHPGPTLETRVSISQPEVCSTSQLVLECIVQSEYRELLNASIGTPLYLGIVTDTGSFRFSSVQPRTHELLAELLRVGVRHWEVHEKTFDNNRIERLKLRGYAIAEKLEIIEGYGVALLSLTTEELNRFDYVKGDTEGLVNVALSVEGVSVAIFLSEKEDKVKLSFRSQGDIAVNVFASEQFDGGGHLNAAGGVSFVSMEETRSRIIELIPDYFKLVNA